LIKLIGIFCLLNTDASTGDGIQVGFIAAAGVGGALFVIILFVITVAVIRCCRKDCNKSTFDTSTHGMLL